MHSHDFSIALGVMDIFPVLFFAIFTILQIFIIRGKTNKPLFIGFCVGAVGSSLIACFIPIYKILCGLGIFDFTLPVAVVTAVNFCFFIAGSCLFLSTTKRFSKFTGSAKKLEGAGLASSTTAYNPVLNAVAIIMGIIGMLLIYVGAIRISLKLKNTVSVVLVSVSIIITVLIGVMGCVFDMSNVIFHWIEEIANTGAMLLLVVSALKNLNIIKKNVSKEPSLLTH